MNEEVLDVLDRCDADSGLSLVYMERRDYATIRAELTRLTEIADSVDPLVVRLGEVTTQLEAAEKDSKRLDWVEDHAHALDWDPHDPMKRVIRGDDGAEFCGDTWREQIDAATQEGEG